MAYLFVVLGARQSCVSGWAILQGRDLDGWKASCCLCQPGVKSSVWGGSVSEEQVWHSAFASGVRNECSLWLSRSLQPWQAKGMCGSSVFGSFTSSTATCWHLPPPRCETEEEDVAHCVNKSPQCAFLCLHVPWPARATNHAPGSLS